MVKRLDQILAELPADRRARIDSRVQELATLKDLRHALERTQKDVATRLGVGQDTVSRIEQRSDILLSTLRRYIEAMGGELELMAHFPGREPFYIDRIGKPMVAVPRRMVSARPAKSPAGPFMVDETKVRRTSPGKRRAEYVNAVQEGSNRTSLGAAEPRKHYDSTSLRANNRSTKRRGRGR